MATQYFCSEKRIFWQRDTLFMSNFYSTILGAFGLLFFSSSFTAEPDFKVVTVDFYGLEIPITYDPEMIINFPLRVEEVGLRQAYDRISALPNTSFLENILAQKNRLQLNDWLFYELTKKALTPLYGEAAHTKIELHAYHLLARAGYDVRLTYRRQSIYINAFTQEILYEIPLIEDQGRQYANLTSAGETAVSGQAMYLLNHRPKENGSSFSFKLKAWPNFPAIIKSRTLSFPINGMTKELTIQYDGFPAKLMENYPLIDEHWYLDAPASSLLAASILPQFRTILEGRGTRASLEILARFTRSAFEYKEDKSYFGKSKPMVPDELFFYPFSDCEDRSALFYFLVKELLQLPMIVLAYEDHLSIAVAADIRGYGVSYNGKRYVFCDPTGPSNSSEIGIPPEGYEKQDFEIIGNYP